MTLIALGCVSFGSAQAATYDPLAGFSSVNPSALWSYNRSLNGSVAPITTYLSNGGWYSEGWSTNIPTPLSGFIWTNETGATTNHLTIFTPNAMIGFDPQAYDYVSIDFAAPQAGLYTVSGNFYGIDSRPFAHHVAVFRGTTSLFDSILTSYGQVLPFSNAMQLAAGEKISFRVYTGLGQPGVNYSNLATGFRATITSVPEAPVWAALIAGFAATGFLMRRRPLRAVAAAAA